MEPGSTTFSVPEIRVVVPGKASTLLFSAGLEFGEPLLPGSGEGVSAGLLGMAPMIEATMPATSLSAGRPGDEESSGKAALFSGGAESMDPPDGVPAGTLFAGVSPDGLDTGLLVTGASAPAVGAGATTPGVLGAAGEAGLLFCGGLLLAGGLLFCGGLLFAGGLLFCGGLLFAGGLLFCGGLLFAGGLLFCGGLAF